MTWMIPVSSKGQITLPVSIRRAFGIGAGEDRIIVKQEKDRIVLEPVVGDIMDLYGILKDKSMARKHVDFSAIRLAVRRKMAEHIVKEGMK